MYMGFESNGNQMALAGIDACCYTLIVYDCLARCLHCNRPAVSLRT